MVRYLKISTLVSLWILNAASAAEVVTSPFQLELSQASTPILLGGIQGFQSPQGTIQTDLPNQSVTSPYNVTLSGIHLQLNYAFNTPTPSSTLNQWAIQSKDISAELVVDRIDATKTIVVQSGSITLTLNIDASCTNVHLQLPSGATHASGVIALALDHGTPSFTFQNFAADWAPSSWKVTSLTCQGPNGFGDQVAQAAEEQLRSIDPFYQSIRDEIQAKLNTVGAGTPLVWTAQASGNSGIALTLRPSSLQLLPSGGALIAGEADFTFENLQTGQCAEVIQDSLAAPSGTVQNDELKLPYSTIHALLRCGYLNDSLAVSWTSQQFPAFQSMLGNPLADWFVWPDLANFSSRDVFDFTLYPFAMPEVGGMTADSKGRLAFYVNAPLTLAIQAPHGSSMEHYVDLTTTLSGPAALSVQNGILSVTQNTSKLRASARWDELYVSTHKPNQKISTSVMSGYLQSFLANPGIRFALPVWSVDRGFDLSVQDLIPQSDGVVVRLNVKTPSSAQP